MKKTKQCISFLLAAALLLTGIPAAAYEPPSSASETLRDGYASSEDAYAIYPVPQHADYAPAGSFTLDDEISVVCESGIDDPTKTFLNEILDNYGRTAKPSQTIGGGSQILLGVKGSGQAVDAWFDEHVTQKNADLFEKTDAYLLSAKDGTIAILGKDEDAAYYGLATLQMLFSSFAGAKFLNVQIEDYAVMKMRGFIEGFYGGWNYEGRESLMRFARDYKMNTYIYASKTDSYHKNDVLYPQEDIDKIAQLVRIGEETKVKYSWSVHISYFFNSLAGKTVGSAEYNAAFDQKFDKLIEKFDQLYAAGVRKFSILNDDFGSGTHEEVVRLLNKLDEEFLVPKGCENLSYCMQGYNKAWSTPGELEALKGLNDSIDLFWTGDDVNAPITQETVDFVKEKTDHEAVYWLNFPVNEHAHSGIFLGEISHYVRDGVTGLAGAVSNPSRFTEANKVGLFQLASLFWNNNDYLAQAERLWSESFRYLQPEVYEAYYTIGKNVSNCPNSSRVSSFPESEYLKDALDSISQKIGTGQPIANDPDAQMLKAEFANILAAIETFRSECKNETLIAELDPWLKSLTDTTTAGEAALMALFAMEEGDIDTAWRGLGVAGKAIATQNTYPSYEGSNNVALAGSKRLVPFVTKAIAEVNKQLIPFLNPSIVIPPSFFAVLAGTDRSASAEGAKAMDGNEATTAKFNNNQQTDDYFGVDMGRSVPITSIDILQGETDTDADIFHNAVLEYSANGADYTALETWENDSAPRRITKENLSIEARFIRLRLTKTGTTNPNKANYWTHIREITINGGIQKEETYGLFASDGITAELNLEGLTYSIADTEASLAPGAYIGVQLKELSGLKNISCDMSAAASLTLQHSPNAILWTDVPGPADFDGEAARYVRLYNGTDDTVRFTLSDFSVTVFGNAVNPFVSSWSPELNTIREGALENLFDGRQDTFVFFESAQKANHELIIDFGAEAPIHDLTITQESGNPKFYNAAFYLSTDKNSWGDPIMTVEELNGTITSDHRTEENGFIKLSRNDLDGRSARYLKILITRDSGYRLKINEIEINQTIETTDQPIQKIITNTLTGNLNQMIDGDISTAYTSDTPSDGTAYIKYPLTEQTELSSVTFLQSASDITGASVTAEIYDGRQTREETLGTLSEGSTSFYFTGGEHILSFTVTWPEGTTPALYEIITNTGENILSIHFEGEGAPSERILCREGRTIRLPENAYVKEGYTFKGWSDGSGVFAAGANYRVGASDVTLTAIWEKDAVEEQPPAPDNPNPPAPPTDNPNPPAPPDNGTQTTIQENQTYEVDNGSVQVTSIAQATVAYVTPKTSEKKVTIPDTVELGGKTYTVTSVAAGAFKNNKTLTQATIGKNIEVIESNAFSGCAKLTKITLKSARLKRICSNAFQNCKKLKSITIKSKVLEKVDKNAFKGIHKNAVIKVPASSYKKYKKLLAKKGQKSSVKIKK